MTLRRINFLKSLYYFNFISALQNKKEFISRIFGMLLNNIILISFWYFFFRNIPASTGMNLNNVMYLFSIISLGFGLSHVFFGNAYYMGSMILEGKLDYYMLLPKSTFMHIICSKIEITPSTSTRFLSRTYQRSNRSLPFLR